MDEHTFTLYLYAHIFTNSKNVKCKVHPKYNLQKKDRLLPYQIWEAHDIKEQYWQGGIMFFFIETTANKSYKAQSNDKVNNIKEQACYRKG